MAKPDNLAMSPHTLINSGKLQGWREVEKPLNTQYKILLLPTTLINKLYNPKHKESDMCESISAFYTLF